MDCTPSALAQAAKCFSCIPRGMVPAAKTMLLSKWAGCENSEIICDVVLSDAGDSGTNQTYVKINDAEYDAPNGYQLILSGVWQVYNGVVYLYTLDPSMVSFPDGEWTPNSDSVPLPVPVGQYSPQGCTP